MKIAFFLGSADISGGTYVIFQHALFARRAGHEVTIVLLYPYAPSQVKWHPALEDMRFVPVQELGEEHFDLAIATWWKSATELHVIRADQYAYFVQSIESRFYPEHETPLRNLVDSTYNLGLPAITEATWIQQHLRERHGVDAQLVRNGIRKDLYSTEGRREAAPTRHGELRVLVEGPFGVFFKNVGSSLRLSRKSQADETWLLTSTDLRRYPGVKRVFSRVPIDAVAPIYRSCDVILKLSYVEGMFGPPLEMFHCGGTAIVYDVTGHDEYIRHMDNALVLRRDDERGVVEALNRLREDTALLERLKAGAIQTASQWPDWEHSSARFEESMRAIMALPPVARAELAQRNHAYMADYVRDENIRLASQPRLGRLRNRISSRLYRVPQLAALRKWGGQIFEGWGKL